MPEDMSVKATTHLGRARMTELDEIKFNVPAIEGAELEYIRASV